MWKLVEKEGAKELKKILTIILCGLLAFQTIPAEMVFANMISEESISQDLDETEDSSELMISNEDGNENHSEDAEINQAVNEEVIQEKEDCVEYQDAKVNYIYVESPYVEIP